MGASFLDGLDFFGKISSGMRYTLLFLLTGLMAIPATADETLHHYLSGTGMDDTVEWEFMCDMGQNSGFWTTIPVPSNWELQGFGQYHYGHEIRAYYAGRKPDLEVETGFYKHRFKVPADWLGKSIRIIFEGAMTDTLVKVNGIPAGPIHQGGFYRFSYDVTGLLHYGLENLLEVEVREKSSDETVDQAERGADFWTFGGIYRPVYLEIKPEEHIERLALEAGMDGDFSALVVCSGLNSGRAHTLQASIVDLEGKSLGEVIRGNLDASTGEGLLQGQFAGAKRWSAEFPNLYWVHIDLLSDGKVIHRESERFGFRTVEMRPRDGFYINGRKMKFKGVNRHSAWPESGRTLSRELSLSDARLIKDMNMNAVRMSHYPPDKHFLEVCDELGLYVFNELTAWQKPPYATEVGKKLVRSLVLRDLNHPSVVAWNNGNEGGFNTDLDAEFPRWDIQNRPVFHPWELFGGMDTTHYIPYGYATGSFFNGREVFCPTEFLHGLYDGGHGAGLEDFWDLMWKNPLSAGGFLWVFADEGIVRTDLGGIIDTDGNHAPDGILSPYRDKEGSYYTIKEVWAPIHFPLKHLPPTFDGVFFIENRYDFTDLQDCRFAYQLVRLPTLSGKALGNAEVVAGTIPSPQVAPYHKGDLRVDLPDNWRTFDVLYLTATDPHGREIFTWSWPLHSPAEQAMPSNWGATTEEKPVIAETGDRLEVRFPAYRVSFDRESGEIREVRNTVGSLPITRGPYLVPEAITYESVKASVKGSQVEVEVIHADGIGSFRWTLDPSGWVDLHYIVGLNAQRTPGHYMGLTFDLDEEVVEGMTYRGNGPYRVWKNRLRGNRFDVFEKDYNNTITGVTYAYPEFKGFYDQVHWALIRAGKGSFAILNLTEELYLRMLTPEDPPDPANTVVRFPEGDFSLLHGISPIGTKFYPAQRLGPQSRENIFLKRNRVIGRVLFYFGDIGELEIGVSGRDSKSG